MPFSSHPPPRPKPKSNGSRRASKHLSVLSQEYYPSKSVQASSSSDAPPSTDEEDKRAKRSSYIQSVHAEHGRHSRRGSPFVISIPRQIIEVVRRKVQIMKGDWTTQAIILASFVFQAVILGKFFCSITHRKEDEPYLMDRHDLCKSRQRHFGLLQSRWCTLFLALLWRSCRHV